MATSTASPSSSASTTPMPLTPESTGGDMAALQSKKNRRQTAVYNPSKASSLSSNSAQKPLKPFSRSAAKRESVLALGSIEHLQHYFSQTGIVSKRNPLVNKFRNQGLVPAIGGRPTQMALEGCRREKESLNLLRLVVATIQSALDYTSSDME